MAICNEAMFPEVVADRVLSGASWIVNPSNDTWIPFERFAEHQLDIVAMRAVENRRWTVRASTSGPSAVIDPFGRIVARTLMNRAEVLVADIEPLRTKSMYSFVGDGPALALSLLALVASAVITWLDRERPGSIRAESQPLPPRNE